MAALVGDATTPIREGAAGGVIGVLARDAALFLLPKLFAVPVLIGATILALILSTDWLFYGYFSAPAATALAARLGIEMPIAAAVDAILNRDADVDEVIEGLLSRPFRDER